VQRLKEKHERLERWPKIYWWAVDFLKIISPLLIGYFIRVVTEPKQKEPETKTPTAQYRPKNGDTLTSK
jgi:hypothetical protein